jgi:hypothetical protein
MSDPDFLNLLASLEKRLSTIADQAAETREQAQHTLDRLNRLRHDLDRVKAQLIATTDTGTHQALRPTPPG